MRYNKVSNKILFDVFVAITVFCTKNSKIYDSEILNGTLKQILKDIHAEFVKRKLFDESNTTEFAKHLKIENVGNKEECLQFVNKKIKLDCINHFFSMMES